MSKLALVTGASSGIGNAYALELLRQEYDLIVVGRRRERLDELAASGIAPAGSSSLWSPIWPPRTASTRSPSWPAPGP